MSFTINLETLSWNATVALRELDEKFVGTPDYMGVAWFWHHEYRHYLRPNDEIGAGTPAKLRRVHKALLKAGLTLNGESDSHDRVIGRVLRCEVLR
jgi:hypothetical protein